MKTPRKQFNELPLPAGWKTPPDGWLFIGMDQDLPRDKEAKVMACPGNGNGWYGPESYLSCAVSPLLAIAAPARLVRKLSTQKRAARKAKKLSPVGVQAGKSWLSVADWAKRRILPDLTTEPRKPYDELPLPVGMAQPPDGFVYVGQPIKDGELPGTLLNLFPERPDDKWESRENGNWTHRSYHLNVYAAPAELCNRLPSPPDASAGHVKLAEP